MMNVLFPYKPFFKFILRTPLLPYEHLEDNLSNIYKLTDETIENAIHEASSSLFIAIKKKNSKTQAYSKRIICSLYRYIARMSTRCTPFGLLAACSTGTIENESSKLIISNRINYNAYYDFRHFYRIISALYSHDNVMEGVFLVPNYSIYLIGDEIRFYEITPEKDGFVYIISSIKNNPIIDKVLEFIKEKSRLFNELVDFIQCLGYEYLEARTFINDLVKFQLLLPVRPNGIDSTGFDVIRNEFRKFKSHSFYTEEINLYSKINNFLLDETNKERELNLGSLFDKLESFGIKEPILQIDCTRNLNGHLSKAIIHDIEKSILFLNNFVVIEQNRNLKDFTEKFRERYDRQEIPLLKALDPEIGISYGSVDMIDGEDLIKGVIILRNDRRNQSNRLADIILNKIINTSSYEINIENDICSNTKDFKMHELHSTIYAIIELFLDSDGSEIVYFKGAGGSTAANLISRFAKSDSNIMSLCKSVVEFENNDNEDSFVAEVVFLSDYKSCNIIRRPNIRDYQITISITDENHKMNIPLSDLYIKMQGDGIVLFSKRFGKKIIPRITSAQNVNRNNNIPVYRFLYDLQNYQKIKGYGINVELLLPKLDFYPRIRIGKIIISLAKWRIDIHEFRDIYNKDKNIVESFRQWRMSKKIPIEVLYQYGDQLLYVNFNMEVSIMSIYHKLHLHSEYIFFCEYLVSSFKSPVMDEHGFHYTNEIIVPFYKYNNHG